MGSSTKGSPGKLSSDTEESAKQALGLALKNDIRLTAHKPHKTKPHWLQNSLACEFMDQLYRVVTHARDKNQQHEQIWHLRLKGILDDVRKDWWMWACGLFTFCSWQLTWSGIHGLMPKEVKWSSLDPSNVSHVMIYIKNDGISRAHWNNLVGIWNPKCSNSEPQATSWEFLAALDPAQPPRVSVPRSYSPSECQANQ